MGGLRWRSAASMAPHCRSSTIGSKHSCTQPTKGCHLRNGCRCHRRRLWSAAWKISNATLQTRLHFAALQTAARIQKISVPNPIRPKADERGKSFVQLHPVVGQDLLLRRDESLARAAAHPPTHPLDDPPRASCDPPTHPPCGASAGLGWPPGKTPER